MQSYVLTGELQGIKVEIVIQSFYLFPLTIIWHQAGVKG